MSGSFLLLDVHNWPILPSSTYSIIATRCAGRYSMNTVAAIGHINSNCGRHSDHQQQQFQNVENVSVWAANRFNCLGVKTATGKVNSAGDVRTTQRTSRGHPFVDTTMINTNPFC